MKSIWLSLIFITAAIRGLAQTEVHIAGSVIDAQNAPIEFANIVLKLQKDSAIVKLDVSDVNGTFTFNNVPLGNYYIEVSFVGYSTARSNIFSIAARQSSLTLDPIVLQDAGISLAGVVVVGKKPLIEQKIDRMVVNVDAYVSNVGTTALEVLEKSPGIAVDRDGNISLKGKSEVMVMMDGKPSYLSSTELVNLLGSMSSNELSQIEIMTNPSAKYDAAGNAGVINIKTKKSLNQGLNGSATLSYGQGIYPKFNNSISLNYRNNKLNAFFNYGYNLNNGFFNLDFERNFYSAEGIKNYTLLQNAKRINHSQNQNLKLGLDYYINPQTTLGITTSGFLAPQKQEANTLSYIKTPDGNISSIEETIVPVDNKWKDGTLNLNFHTFADSSGRDLSINMDYLHYNFSGNQDIIGLSYNPEYELLSKNAKRNILPLTIDIYSGRLDFAQPLKNDIQLETGLKTSVVKTNNISNFYNLNNGIQSPDSTLSNAFDYSENINAAYLNLNRKLAKWTFQGGLRVENTNYKGAESALSQPVDSTFNRSYVKLFPTAFISYELNKDNQFALSIGRRIDRPEYRQLNPFVSFLDKYTINTGNPYLQPQFSTNIELSHSYKNQFTTTINYSIIHDMINEMFIQNDSLIMRTYGNIGTRYNYGIAESATIEWGKWYAGTLFANLYYNKYNGVINGFPFAANQFTLSLNVNNQFRFSDGWSAELSGNYISRNRDEGQAIILPSGQVSAGVSKSLFDDKASLKFGVRDIFYTQNPKEIQNFQDIKSVIRISRDTRVFTIAFAYRFGANLKTKADREEQLDEQKRVKTF